MYNKRDLCIADFNSWQHIIFVCICFISVKYNYGQSYVFTPCLTIILYLTIATHFMQCYQINNVIAYDKLRLLNNCIDVIMLIYCGQLYKSNIS